MLDQFNKNQIARSFNRAVKSYDQVDFLQRKVGDELLDNLKSTTDSLDRIIDLGCGLGKLTAQLGDAFAGAEVLGLDLADEMVLYASRHFCSKKNVSFLSADADKLPLPNCYSDLIFSNLMLQWSPNLDVTLSELARVLTIGGGLFYSTFGLGSLKELRDSWSKIDDYEHVSNFISEKELLLSMNRSGFKEIKLESRSYCRWFNNVYDLMGELKMLGAHNLSPDRCRGLLGKSRLKQLQLFYDEYRGSNNKLPLTYEVFYVSARKE